MTTRGPRTGPEWAKDPSFVDHSASPIMRVGLHLTAESLEPTTSDDYDALGSAVLIHPMLAITAKHVVDDYMKRFGFDSGPGEVLTRFRLSAWQLISNGPGDPNTVAVRYGVVRLLSLAFADLSLLFLTPWSGIPASWDQRCARLTVNAPKVGDRAVAFGYHQGAVQRDGKNVTIIRQPSTSVGEVTEVHLSGRPGVPWANFTTNALYKGGMSGGLVINDDGHVCGLVTSCMPGFDGEPHYSAVSLLFPLMALETEFQLPGDDAPKLYTLLDVAKRGIIGVEGLERLEILRDASGKQQSITYRPAPSSG